MRPLAVGVVLAVSALAVSAASDLEGIVTVGGKPVAEAVVWLDAPHDAPKPRPGPPAVLEQRNLAFLPHVLAVQVGTKVEFPNSDRVLHNVFSYHEGTPFDLGLYPIGAVKFVPFDHPGLSRIFCNIHSQMSAYVMVVDTPYFAVSNSEGRFTLRGVPNGTYHYHAWRAGEKTILNASIDIRPDVPFVVQWP